MFLLKIEFAFIFMLFTLCLYMFSSSRSECIGRLKETMAILRLGRTKISILGIKVSSGLGTHCVYRQLL